VRWRRVGILGNAVPKGPIFTRNLDEVDENILFSYALLGGQKLGNVSVALSFVPRCARRPKLFE
jgi:hypothetical protein